MTPHIPTLAGSWPRIAVLGYWISDFRTQRPVTKEEKFNHAHAQLRNVIERAYGVLKARFPILREMAPYPFPVQRDIVIACVAVHNFIRKYNLGDPLFGNFGENVVLEPEEEDEEDEVENVQGMEWGSESVEYMTTLREQIATHLR